MKRGNSACTFLNNNDSANLRELRRMVSANAYMESDFARKGFNREDAINHIFREVLRFKQQYYCTYKSDMDNPNDSSFSVRVIEIDSIYYRYHSNEPRHARKHTGLTTKAFLTKEEARENLAVLEKWNAMDHLSEYLLLPGCWVIESFSLQQNELRGARAANITSSQRCF